MKKLNLCTWIRQARFPKTDEGRRAYIKEALKDDSLRPYRIKVGAVLLIRRIKKNRFHRKFNLSNKRFYF